MNISERDFVRIDTALKGHLRILPNSRPIPMFSSASTPGTPSPVGTQLPNELELFLGQLDEKLDTILALLNLQNLQEDFPVPVLVHDISGAGLRFSAPQSFEIGMTVEIVVELGFHPKILAGTLGVIIRRDIRQDQELWAMKFEGIRAREREKIIAFVTAEQRVQIRENTPSNNKS
jgi:hypothetical protein